MASRKRSLAAKKGWRKRRRSGRVANPRRRRKSVSSRRRRRRNAWPNDHRGHVKAGRRGWWRRRRGSRRKSRKGKYYRLRTSRGRRYKRPYKARTGAYRMWKNPRHYIRTRNPGVKDMAIPVLTAIGGLIVALFLVQKIPSDKIPSVAGMNLASLIPAAAGVAIMTFGTKKLPQHAKILHGLAIGMIISSAIDVFNKVIAPKANLAPLSLAGYTVYPGPAEAGAMGSYVRSMQGYVRSKSLGQLDDEVGGADTAISSLIPYQPQSVKPFGLGVPLEERRWNEFLFSGVYGKSVYE